MTGCCVVGSITTGGSVVKRGMEVTLGIVNVTIWGWADARVAKPLPVLLFERRHGGERHAVHDDARRGGAQQIVVADPVEREIRRERSGLLDRVGAFERAPGDVPEDRGRRSCPRPTAPEPRPAGPRSP
jgi:hypothetical protein